MDRTPLLASSAGLTTAVVAVVVNGVIEGASVGDSEAWLVNDDDYAVLTEHQNRKPLIGSRSSRPVAFGPVPMAGTLILGSDGLFKYTNVDRLLSIARSPTVDSIPRLLLDAVKLPSGRIQDDFSVIACRGAG
jgi:serine/threonine protein phosphatase PrpC